MGASESLPFWRADRLTPTFWLSDVERRLNARLREVDVVKATRNARWDHSALEDTFRMRLWN